jgi:hypothetical protein
MPVDLHQSGRHDKESVCGMGSRNAETVRENETMPVRLRKLIGTILIIVLVISYALIATTFATLLLGASAWWAHLLYFFLTGLLWILPAMLVIKWMEKPGKPR